MGCLDYRVVGTCHWRYCRWVVQGIPPVPVYVCSVRTSVKYAHWIPDLLVSAYGAVSEHPWREATALGIVTPGAVDGGTAARSAAGRGTTGLRFKLAEAVGSPGLAWIDAISSLGLAAGMVCPSQASAFGVHFVSRLDPAWREDLLQAPQTLLNLDRGVREPGWPTTGSAWGAMYPRSGFIQQAHDYKAAAVVAQRVADIVTRPRGAGQPHVYSPLTYPAGGVGYWPPVGPVSEDDLEHKWQLLSPGGGGSCSRFAATDGPLVGVVDPLGPKQAANGAYLFNLWRPYACCASRGTFLFDVD